MNCLLLHNKILISYLLLKKWSVVIDVSCTLPKNPTICQYTYTSKPNPSKVVERMTTAINQKREHQVNYQHYYYYHNSTQIKETNHRQKCASYTISYYNISLNEREEKNILFIIVSNKKIKN